MFVKLVCECWYDCFGYLIYFLTLMFVNYVQRLFLSRALWGNNNCEIKRIIWRRKYYSVGTTSSMDFIGIRKCFTSCEYVLKPNVTLYCVEKDYVYFVECVESLNIFNVTSHPFLYNAQFQNAVNVIAMPLPTFYRLADKVGDPKKRLCYMASTGRCGSTVLVKAMGNVPESLVLAEPDCLTNIGFLKVAKSIGHSDYEKLLVALIRLLCKNVNEVKRIFIKSRCCGTAHIQVIKKHFPDSVITFGYRNSLENVASFLRMMGSITERSVSMYFMDNDLLAALVPYFRKRMFYYFCKSCECFPDLVSATDMNTVEQLTYSWANCIQHAVDFRKSGGKLLPVLYEDLVEDRARILGAIFKEMNIDKQYVDAAMEAFNSDSQAGSPISREKCSAKKTRVIHVTDIVKASIILAKFELPELGKEFRL